MVRAQPAIAQWYNGPSRWQPYWKIEAIDQYRNITESDDVFSFRTDNTNAPPSIASQFISSAVHFISLDQVDMSFWQMDEFGMMILDEFGHLMFNE